MLGVNSRLSWPTPKTEFQARRRRESMEQGVTFLCPRHRFSLSPTTGIEPDASIGQYVVSDRLHRRQGCGDRAFCHIEHSQRSAPPLSSGPSRGSAAARSSMTASTSAICRVKNAHLETGSKPIT